LDGYRYKETQLMRINVAKTLKQAEEQRKKSKPLPKITIKRQSKPKVQSAECRVVPEKAPTVPLREREGLLDELQAEIRGYKIERAKLSSQIYPLVQQVATDLAKESPTLKKEFLAGRLPMPEIKEHYFKIQAWTDKAIVAYDKLRHVQQYGVLPAPVEKKPISIENGESMEAKAIHYEIRRLDDLVHKTRKKMEGKGLKKPVKSDKVLEYREKIALAEARRYELKEKLKQLQYEARVQQETANVPK
jgi:hypothetical protein